MVSGFFNGVQKYKKKAIIIDVDLLKPWHLFLFANDCGTTVPRGINSPSESRRGARRAG
jgi:hypothetical protein